MPSFIFRKEKHFPTINHFSRAHMCWWALTDCHRLVIIIQLILCNTISAEFECAYRNFSHILFRGIEPGLLSFKFHSEKLTLFFSQRILVLCPEAPFGGRSQKHSLFFLPPERTALSDELCSLPEADRCRRGINWGLFLNKEVNEKSYIWPGFWALPIITVTVHSLLDPRFPHKPSWGLSGRIWPAAWHLLARWHCSTIREKYIKLMQQKSNHPNVQTSW